MTLRSLLLLRIIKLRAKALFAHVQRILTSLLRGLIVRKPQVHIANAIYQEIIPREITSTILLIEWPLDCESGFKVTAWGVDLCLPAKI